MNIKQYKSIMQSLKEYDSSHNSNWYDRACLLKVNAISELMQIYTTIF